MVAIDWCDDLRLQMTSAPGILLSVDWLPDRQTVAKQLCVAPEDPLLDIPSGRSNLVYRALAMINEATGYRGGWDVQLGKRIPSGAGMGGASSDAASTLRLAQRAILDAQPELARALSDDKIEAMAASLGSDVPFFLGDWQRSRKLTANENSKNFHTDSLARALGRGERLSYYEMPLRHHFIVVYPAIALSTAAVYSQASPSENPKSGLEVVERFLSTAPNTDDEMLYNALARPASGLSSRIAEALECLRKSQARSGTSPSRAAHCQMTGSGSACFTWRGGSATEDPAQIAAIRDSMSGGALVKAVATCSAAPEIHIA